MSIQKKRMEHINALDRNTKSALLENIDNIPKDNLTISFDDNN